MDIRKTKKGNKYIHTPIKSMTDYNKKLADQGKAIFDQYSAPDCKHGETYGECFVCGEV